MHNASMHVNLSAPGDREVVKGEWPYHVRRDRVTGNLPDVKCAPHGSCTSPRNLLQTHRGVSIAATLLVASGDAAPWGCYARL